MTDINRNVFVIHGRNNPIRDSLFQFLRAIGLFPIEWSKAIEFTGKASPFVGEILEAAFSKAQAIIVLLTGDDNVILNKEFQRQDDLEIEKTYKPQARPNVLFEAGIAFGVYPERTVLVEVGYIKPFSDIAGRHIIKMNNSTIRRQDLAERLKLAGCNIDLSGRDWHNVGNFEISLKQSLNVKEELQAEEIVSQSNKDKPIYIGGIHEGAIKILQFLSDIEELGQNISLKGIADKLNMRRTAITHHIDQLYSYDYIGRSLEANIYYYYLKAKGRGFLVENNLV